MSTASPHHPQMAEAEAPTLAPSEPNTAASDGRALSTAGTSHQGSDPAAAVDPHRETRVGGNSASHFSATAPPAADHATATTASAAATLAAFSSPDVTVGIADGATADAASAAGAGMDVDTDPIGELLRKQQRKLSRARGTPTYSRVAHALAIAASCA